MSREAIPVQVIPLSAVVIGARQRSEIPDDHIRDLAKSINDEGLIHAPTVDAKYNLIAGECRLKAISTLQEPYRYGNAEIPVGYLPVVQVLSLDDDLLFRIELMENLRRKNLTPLDEAKAIARLHQSLVEEHGDDWSKRDTGQELDRIKGVSRDPQSARDDVGDALLLHSFADDPDVGKAKTRSEATRIAKRKLESQLMSGLGELVQVSKADIDLLEGSCLDLLPTIPTMSVNGIIVDPPYGMDADTFGAQTNAVGHQYADDIKTARKIWEAIFVEGARICMPDAHLYMFCNHGQWHLVADMAEAAGWKPYPTPLIWHKPGLGHAPQPGYFSRRYECILFAQRGNRKLSKTRGDVFEYNAVLKKRHAAEKPIDLLQELCSLSFFPGETVLDPCCGSGSTLIAAAKAQMRAIGIEADPTAINVAKLRIADET